MSIAREIQTLKKRAERVLMAESPPELGLIVYSEGDATPMNVTPWDLTLKIEDKQHYYLDGRPINQDPLPETEDPGE